MTLVHRRSGALLLAPIGGVIGGALGLPGSLATRMARFLLPRLLREVTLRLAPLLAQQSPLKIIILRLVRVEVLKAKAILIELLVPLVPNLVRVAIGPLLPNKVLLALPPTRALTIPHLDLGTRLRQAIALMTAVLPEVEILRLLLSLLPVAAPTLGKQTARPVLPTLVRIVILRLLKATALNVMSAPLESVEVLKAKESLMSLPVLLGAKSALVAIVPLLILKGPLALVLTSAFASPHLPFGTRPPHLIRLASASLPLGPVQRALEVVLAVAAPTLGKQTARFLLVTLARMVILPLPQVRDLKIIIAPFPKESVLKAKAILIALVDLPGPKDVPVAIGPLLVLIGPPALPLTRALAILHPRPGISFPKEIALISATLLPV